MSAPLRLLIVSQLFPRHDGDAPARYLQFLGGRLAEFGVQPCVVAPHDAGAAEHERIDGIEVHRVRYAPRDADETIAYRGRMHEAVRTPAGAARFLGLVRAMQRRAAEIVESENIDVLAGHWLMPSGWILRRVLRGRRLPVVMTSHGTDIALARKWGGAPYRSLRGFCRGLGRWTTVSSFLRDRIVGLDPELAPRVEVLPLPHDTGVFRPRPDVPRSGTRVLSVTRYTEQKRVPYLLRAFAEAARGRPDATLEIVAQEEPPEAIRSLIAGLDLTARVTCHATVSQEELARMQAGAAIVVLNSVDEGFGLALSESMLCGTAVIGTDSGGIRDIIRDGETGALVRPDDPRALAAAMGRLLDDPGARERLAAAGRVEAAARYDPGRLAGRYAEIVKEVHREGPR